MKAAGSSVAAVGACLLLAEAEIHKVQLDSKSPKRRRIYHLLNLWKRMGKSTWECLLGCLEYLEDVGMMEGIKDYLRKKWDCDRHGMCKFQTDILHT